MSGRALWIGTGIATVLAAAGVALAVTRPPAPAAPPATTAKVDPSSRRAFFGELHLHTAMSFDAWTFGTKLTPDQAYKFARGETVMVPAAQLKAEQGITAAGLTPATRAWPLDFAAVTDHSEYLGAALQLDLEDSPFSRTPFGKLIHESGRAGFQLGEGVIYGPPSQGRLDLAAAAKQADGWAVETRAAADNYQPGKFTTFLAYEWTATAGRGTHMHRNVIFNADHAPPPFTALDSEHPEDLWKYLASVRRRGIDVLAIPHNSNLSDGLDFDWNMSNGRPIDEGYALERALNEPLVEISQTKGTSDTTPDLSPDDEFADFEVKERIYPGESAPHHDGSYVRQAYGRGLVIQAKVGANPFRMGVVGGSDIHNGMSASDEDAFAGGISGIDPRTMRPRGRAARAALDMAAQDGQPEPATDHLSNSSAAITGVWAEENTRPAIFAALKRKETFATTGTRMRLRMFAGWGFTPGLLKRADWVARAYAQGVAMGGDLPARTGGAPAFVVQAMKDPDGANLDRVQIIKVWLDGGGYKEKVFDVALSDGRRDDPATGRAPDVGNTVDLATARYTNSIGAPLLSAVWRDPEFDPRRPAVYYARALQIPTPRWSTYLAVANHLPIPKKAHATIQERAWSSPIWFTPPAAAGRRPG